MKIFGFRVVEIVKFEILQKTSIKENFGLIEKPNFN